MKAKGDSHWTVTSFAFVPMKFLFKMCDCKVDSNFGTRDFSLMLRIFHVHRLAHVRSHMSPGMDRRLHNDTLKTG